MFFYKSRHYFVLYAINWVQKPKLSIMKSVLFTFFSAVFLLTACKTDKKDSLNTDKQIVFTDTSLLKPTDGSADVGVQGNNTPAPVPAVQEKAAKPEVKTIIKYVTVKEKPVRRPVVTNTPAEVSPVPDPEAIDPSTGTSTTGTGTASGTTVPAKKKGGWSEAAKDATIGGVGGAVLGGVIGKGAKGAVIGGVLGAAGGYILGRKKDKRTAANADSTRY